MKLSAHSEVVGILAACAVLMSAPLLILFAKGLAYSGDLIVYASALKLFGQLLAHGEIYPRFLAAANGGLGCPMFLFYPPLAFYLSSIFQPLSTFDPNGFYRLACGMWLACFVSGLACYGWLKPNYPPRTALAGAVIYVLLPYRLIYIYHDFALAQLWALAWLPMLMWATERIEGREPRAIAACAIVYALLALTHIPTFITCTSLPFLLVLLRQRKRCLMPLLQLSISLLLGLGLAAFFLLPEWANRDAVNLAQGLLSGKFRYSLNFLTRDFWLPLPFILIAAWWALRNSAPTIRPWIIALLLILFMMTPLSTPLWEQFTPLRYLQFPVKRFYAPLLLVQCVLCVTLLNTCPLTRSLRLTAAVFVSVHLLLIGGNYTYFPWNDSPDVVPFTALLARTNVISVPEYLTPSTNPGFMNPRTLDAVRETPLVVAQSGDAAIHITEWGERTISFEDEVNSASTLLTVHRFYLPLWHADTPAILAPRTGDGMMTVTLPPGHHLVHLTLNPLAGERTGGLITLLSACITALSLLVPSSRKTYDHLHPPYRVRRRPPRDGA